jgi:hypothetical protein
VPQFLKTVTLKNVAYRIRLAWKNISSRTIKNCWSKCISATGDSIEHEEEFLGFTEEDAREASNTFHDRLHVNDLRAWVHKDVETHVAVYKNDDEIVAQVLNHGRAEYLSEGDSGNEEMCELETPEVSKALDSTSEVMIRWKDCDHLRLLHL